MVQVKKAEGRERILSTAQELFEKKGYAATSMREIADLSGTVPSNLYVYFPSKLAILFAVYGPWFRQQLTDLQERARAIKDPETRLREILVTVWDRLPSADNGFANNIMQALTLAQPSEGYSRDLLHWAESLVAELIASCRPASARTDIDDDALAHILFMAFDGFSMNYKLVGRAKRMDRCIETMCTLVLGATRQEPGRQ